MPTPHHAVVIVEDDESMMEAMHRMLTLAEFASEALAKKRPARGAAALNHTPGVSPSNEDSSARRGVGGQSAL
jgi:hypothetical protein